MTGFEVSAEWFYRWEESRILGTQLGGDIDDLFTPAISEADRSHCLSDILYNERQSEHYPELLFQIGVHYWHLGLPQAGLEYLTQAIETCTILNDNHHVHVLNWLQGWILWKSEQNLTACNKWRQAREGWITHIPEIEKELKRLEKANENARLAYLRCIELEEWYKEQAEKSSTHASDHLIKALYYQEKAHFWENKIITITREKKGIVEKKIWYSDRVHEMGVGLACKPEEAYLWVVNLEAMETNRLSPGFLSQRLAVETSIVENQPEQVRIEVERMINCAEARGPVEKAESYLVCGLADYEIKHNQWEVYLKKAIFLYPLGSLARIWARWLLGAIQWSQSEKCKEAAENWEVAIRDLTHLHHLAEWHNQPEWVNYYADKLSIMKDAMVIQRKMLLAPVQEGI